MAKSDHLKLQIGASSEAGKKAVREAKQDLARGRSTLRGVAPRSEASWGKSILRETQPSEMKCSQKFMLRMLEPQPSAKNRPAPAAADAASDANEIGAKVARRGRYIVFRIAEVAQEGTTAA